MFVGRIEELKEICDAYKTSRVETILLYGRRRVGKSEIIRKSLEDCSLPVVNFECKRTSSKINLENITIAFEHTFNLSNLHFESFDDFFSYAFKFSLDKKYVLVIDEFSFLLENDFNIESSLALAIDKYKNEANLKLIVSGSYVTLMTRMIEYGSHCYGRFNHILLIRPFDYFTSSLFYSNYTAEDKIKIYSVFGGIPYFNSLIDVNKSADENINDLIVKEDSILEHEITEMILLETNKITLLNDLIYMIGTGTTKYKDIVTKMKQYENSRPDYLLNKLIEMNIIRKVTPINQKNNVKKMYYVFSDNLIHFYYKYLFNNPYSINRRSKEFFYNNFIKNDLETSFIPHKFENIAKEFLLKLNFSNKLKDIILDIGTYSFDDAKNKINREFDVVTLDKFGYIAYECKYTNEVINQKVIDEEENQVKNLDINFYKLGFISKNGFAKEIDKSKYICYSIDQFYDFEK